jgi:HSP20 family protein
MSLFLSYIWSFILFTNSADAEKIKAKYENGILRVSIPKKEEAKPRPARQIAIA